ncbi:MAG: hypothetical protein QXV17_12570 [Candidatus Micrarchaeaceae archaeon]
MKFSEIIEPSGGYRNNTTSYFLVLDIAGTTYTAMLNSTGVYTAASGILRDPNGNDVGYFKFIAVVVSSVPSTMTVWNGTSMESEPINFIVSNTEYSERHNMIIPPGYYFINFLYAIGFWLDEDEIREYILHNSEKGKNISTSKDSSIIGSSTKENPANQSQEQNPNDIGKYLIGGPRW